MSRAHKFDVIVVGAGGAGPQNVAGLVRANVGQPLGPEELRQSLPSNLLLEGRGRDLRQLDLRGQRGLVGLR